MYKIVFHRVDFDGIVSAAIVYDYLLKKNVDDKDIAFIPYNHGDDLNGFEEKFENGDHVYIVDLSFSDFSLMYKIKDIVGDNFCWIDHHISGIESYNNILKNNEQHNQIAGLRAINYSAAALTYFYFNHDENFPIAVVDNKLVNVVNLPDFVYYISSYDIWDHSDLNTIYFQNGLNKFDFSMRKPNHVIWSKFLNLDSQFLNHYIEIGKVIYDYKKQQDERSCKNQVFELDFEGFKFLAINRATDSKLFDSVWDDKYDGTLVFWFTNERKWKISFYAPPEKDVDFTVIAKKYGGGGHAHACGCIVEKLPFEL